MVANLPSSAFRHSSRSLADKRPPPNRRPPSHRHAVPSGPWPWIDIEHPCPVYCRTSGADDWWDYPRNKYPNWSGDQIERSQIKQAIEQPWETPCTIYIMGLQASGKFQTAEPIAFTKQNQADLWAHLQTKREVGIRLRVLFVESISGSALQMIGTKYNIEPFFFSSALNWIPARYQEQEIDEAAADVTISLPFIRAMDNYEAGPRTTDDHPGAPDGAIDVQADLILRESDNPNAPPTRRLVVDLLAVHMIRSADSSTLVTYHPPRETRATSAKMLHSRIYYAGASLYWRKLYAEAKDPTFILVMMLWHALYAWDQALEALYQHISTLEVTVRKSDKVELTQELHVTRAHLLHYASLLDDFRRSVEFVRDTPNPAMAAEGHQPYKAKSSELLRKECQILLGQIERLEMSRGMQDMRLKNVMGLVFSRINIADSRQMQQVSRTALEVSKEIQTLTEAAVRDSAAMKQVAFLTMIFLPPSFLAAVFGMNINILDNGTSGSWRLYLVLTASLSALTIWVLLAYLPVLSPPYAKRGWRRFLWPWAMVKVIFRSCCGRRATTDLNTNSNPSNAV